MGDNEKQNNPVNLTENTKMQDYYDFMLKKEQMTLFGVTAENQKKVLGMSEIARLEMDILTKLNGSYSDADPRLLQIYAYFGTRNKSEIAKKLAEKKYHKNMAKKINNDLMDDAQFENSIKDRNAAIGNANAGTSASLLTAFGIVI
jgi:hypothetical protein